MKHQPAAYDRHVRELCAAFNVELAVDPTMRPEDATAKMTVDRKRRRVTVSPVIDDTTYAVALHEIGHLLAPAGLVRDANDVAIGLMIHEEMAAWEWAAHYALEWTPPMESVKAWALSTYLDVQQQQAAVAAARARAARPTVRVNSDAADFMRKTKWGQK